MYTHTKPGDLRGNPGSINYGVKIRRLGIAMVPMQVELLAKDIGGWHNPQEAS